MSYTIVSGSGGGSQGPQGFQGPTGSQGHQGATGSDGSSMSIWKYLAKTTTTSGYPSNGRVQWDNATQISATALDISHLTDDNLDIDIFLALLSVGQKITIQDRNISSNYQTWQITGSSTNFNPGTPTSYWQYPVSLISSGGTGTTNFGSGTTLFIAITSTGIQGPQGFQGPTGPAGSQGFQGNQGFQGATGPQGFQGPTGSQGFQGATGSSGLSSIVIDSTPITSGTSSLILFQSAAGNVSESPGLAFNATSNYLQIGTSSGTASLSIVTSTASAATNAIQVRNSAAVSILRLTNDGKLIVNNNLQMNDASNSVNFDTLLGNQNYFWKNGGTTRMLLAGSAPFGLVVGGQPSATNYKLMLWTNTVSAQVMAQFINGTTGQLISDGLIIGVDTDNLGKIKWQEASDFVMYGNTSTEYIRFNNTNTALGLLQKVIVGSASQTPTARLHIVAGSASANFAPLKFTSGTNLATPEDGAIEYDGTDYFATAASTREKIHKGLYGTFSGVGAATTTFTVTFGGTQPNSTYKVFITPTVLLAAAAFYVTNKTTTTFDVVYLAGLTGTVTFDWNLIQ